jgi:hypothetical protein
MTTEYVECTKCDWTGLSWTRKGKGCPECEAPYKESVIKQKVVWMEWVKSDNFCGGIFKSIPMKVDPVRVWTLWNHCDKSKKPELPFVPVQRGNAVMEDQTHDWNCHHGKFKYYTRFMDCSCWILVEYRVRSKKRK